MKQNKKYFVRKQKNFSDVIQPQEDKHVQLEFMKSTEKI